jgi:hypothetical protein
MAAASAAARSFFPPLAALTAWIVAAAFCRSPLSVSCGDLFFFFGGALDGDDEIFFFLMALPGFDEGREGGAGLFVPDDFTVVGFDC